MDESIEKEVTSLIDDKPKEEEIPLYGYCTDEKTIKEDEEGTNCPKPILEKIIRVLKQDPSKKSKDEEESKEIGRAHV